MAMASPPIEILLVEDNPADVRLTLEALKDAKVANRLHVARDGVEAIRALKDPGSATPRPDLILLDLNLPRKDGREVLKEIRQDEALRHIPVVILSTSQAEQDIVQSYRLGANAFVTKPAEIDQFFQVVQSLEQFWLAVAKLARP
ncbi:MAG TPA: response regulator [Vicinamibacterales bacterium]|jgi:CheY-like chemotaxis protein|nr:response regulator [Vicinamibacterales bacterium]